MTKVGTHSWNFLPTQTPIIWGLSDWTRLGHWSTLLDGESNLDNVEVFVQVNNCPYRHPFPPKALNVTSEAK